MVVKCYPRDTQGGIASFQIDVQMIDFPLAESPLCTVHGFCFYELSVVPLASLGATLTPFGGPWVPLTAFWDPFGPTWASLGRLY